MDYESAFLIRSPEMIISKLSILLKKKCLITAYFGENEDSFITTILDIDVEKNRLIFYHTPKEAAIEQLFNSPMVTFKTEYVGIKISFNALKLGQIQHQGVPVFAIPLPSSLMWIEARDFYRVKPLASKPCYCQLVLPDNEPVSLRLYDVSIAGFSIVTDIKDIQDMMTTDMFFEKCKILLADTGEGIVSFEIRNKCLLNPETENRMERMGCRFTHITTGFENLIQRYMQQIERENRQKS
jgi:c-di-GMP-binding flagellar brake protein YcgR